MNFIKFLITLLVVVGVYYCFDLAGQILNAPVTFAPAISFAIGTTALWGGGSLLLTLWRR
jgi:hypothetical protein